MGVLGLAVAVPALAFAGTLGLSALTGPPVKQLSLPAEHAHATASLVSGRQPGPAADHALQWSGVPTWAPTGAAHGHNGPGQPGQPRRSHPGSR